MNTVFRYRALFVIFFISGFAGLIYESIWSHYLKLFLGHAAYSQVLVLSIFMGGMALGAWLESKVLSRNINLLYAYAFVEMLIGIMGIGFHGIFEFVMEISFNNIIPVLPSPELVHIYQWCLGGLLIFPQSILLGVTFPLMSNGLLRMQADRPGRSISLLYFGNSIGAAIGVLASGFYLIAKTGMPGTILSAGIINILLAIAVYYLAKEQPQQIPPPVQHPDKSIPQILLWASFLTGMASFIYELIWLRMLSMVLGASTHAFELMLSAFIMGLAFGGLWIHQRIDRINHPLHFGAIVQICMGLAALSTLILYGHTFDLMAFLIRALKLNEEAYFLFNLGSHLIALLVMLPATFLAGMTLPLFTWILLKNNYGERSLSHIYVSNMLGAITGIIFVVFIGMPALGLHGSMLVGSGIDLLLGFALLVYAGSWRRYRPVIAVVSVTFIVISMIADIDPLRMASGVFRYGLARQPENPEILFHQDGKTATVTVLRHSSGNQSIYSNGKPDASVIMRSDDRDNRGRNDEITQTLLGALPLAFHPGAKRIANIGMGSGMTTHTVLSWPGVERVDTIEIEAEIIKGAEYFRPENERVFSDPRSHIHVEDAKTFFSLSKDKYDVIISEPSNPWVSGVSSLYTREFYKRIKGALNDDGYLVQWLHLYEINDRLVYSVLKALSEQFRDFRIYATDDLNVVIIASPSQQVGAMREDIFGGDDIREELSSVGINHIHDFDIRYLADFRMLEPILRMDTIPVNSDYFPILDLHSTKARFMRDSFSQLNTMKHSMAPVTRFLLDVDVPDPASITASKDYVYSMDTQRALTIYQYITGAAVAETGDFQFNRVTIDYLLNAAKQCTSIQQEGLWLQQLYQFAGMTFPYLSETQFNTALDRITPDCPGILSPRQQDWLDVFKALQQRDDGQIIYLTRRLLENPGITTIEAEQFLLEVRLLSLFMLGNAAEFATELDHHAPRLYTGPVPWAMELLQRHLLARQPKGKAEM